MKPPVSPRLIQGDIELVGRIMPASNQTWLGRLGPATTAEEAQPDSVEVVYKPVAGEQPLWDFPDGTLALRERAAYLVSELLGWSVVPPTVLREGPLGRGMVQLWCEPSPHIDVVDLVPQGQVPPGYVHVLDALDGAERPVSLVHEDSAPVRRMALFDIVTNNTDRKGGHILAMPDGHRYGVDHGICFHPEDKLRTVLWGFAGRPLDDEEIVALQGLGRALSGLDELAELLTGEEIEATHSRLRRLLRRMVFPRDTGGWPSIPWPPF